MEYNPNQPARTTGADIDDMFFETSRYLAEAQTFLITGAGNVREPYKHLHTVFAALFTNTQSFGDMIKPDYDDVVNKAEEWLHVSLRVSRSVAARNLQIGCRRVSKYQRALVQAGVVKLKRE